MSHLHGSPSSSSTGKDTTFPNRRMATTAGASDSSPPPSWNPVLRDRQARGKDPYSPLDDSVVGGRSGRGEDESMPNHFHPGQGLPRETYEDREKKDFAMAVLDNPDMLLMHALSNNDSIAGQRLRFLTMMCPVEQEKVDADADAAVAREEALASKRDPTRKDRRRGGEGGRKASGSREDED